MDQYKSRYSDLKFERQGLFQLIRETYACIDVLYPGCSIHITPSLYFPHVVYVDHSLEAAQFFAESNTVKEFVNRHKVYKQPAFIRFIEQDYSTALPLMEASFDLLLALFAGGISDSCIRYLKIGGMLLTNNHRSDALEAVQDKRLVLKAFVRYKKGKYQIEADDLDRSQIAVQRRNSKNLKRASQGMEYVEKETYYLFERLR